MKKRRKKRKILLATYSGLLIPNFVEDKAVLSSIPNYVED